MEWHKIIAAFRGARWYFVVAALAAFTMYMFKDNFAKMLDMSSEKMFEKKDEVVSIIDRDLMVNGLLEDLRYITASDRAYVFRFHNGQNYFDGTHKIRMSCEYEVVGPGIYPQADRLVDIPTSLFSWFINESIDGNMFYHDIEDIKDIRTKVALREQGIKSIAVSPYYDHNGKLVALIGVDYVGRPADYKDILMNQGLTQWSTEEQKEKMFEISKMVGEAIMYYIQE